MSAPVRLRRSREKGSRLPEGTRCVDRTTRYGNPWRLVPPGGRYVGADGVTRYNGPVHWEVASPQGGLVLHRGELDRAGAAAMAVRFFDDAIDRGDPIVPSQEQIERELAGLNLACYCHHDYPCHVDVLLRRANHGATP